jgi:hypothetical protein
VQIVGLGKRQLEKVPGEDSLQALTLALEFVTRDLQLEAERTGARPEWLGQRESLVFANTFMAALLNRMLHNCLTGLAEAAGMLEQHPARPAGAATARRLRALVASGGYTADPRRVLPSHLAKVRAAGANGKGWKRAST